MSTWFRAPTSPRLRLALALLVAACIVVLAGSGAARAPLSPALASSGELVASERHRRVMRLVSEVVERQHYRQAALDDDMSSQIYERYLEALDGSRSYLLATDIAEFEPLRYELDDAIARADAEPAFEIFTRYQQRNREVLRHAISLLDIEPDFTLDESFEFDRTDEGWPATDAELRELWRKRVKNDALSLLLAGKTWPEASEVLRKRYERVAKRIEQITADDVFETFMNAYSHVYDPHSNYLSPRNSEEYNIAMSLSYEGIGASLQLVDDHVTIMNVLPGGSAAASTEIKVGDRITAVGQGESGPMVDVVGWRLDDVVQLIRGPLNTVVRLQILPGGASPGSPESQLALTRAKITLESQAAQKEVHTLKRGDQDLRVGVISVPSFYQDFQARVAGDADYRSTTRDVRRLIEELRAEGIDSLVMDLRDNGGGHLSEATSLVGLFVERGPVVQLRETNGRIEVLDDPEPGVAWPGPLVVLVNRQSASASEIFAGAIQDYQRGLVVGQQTYGKGSVQNLYPLDRYALGPEGRLWPADRDDRQVLPRHRRQHAASRRRTGHRIAVARQHRRRRREHARERPALGPHQRGALHARAVRRTGRHAAVARARTACREQPGLRRPAGRRRGARGVAQPARSLAQSREAPRGARCHGRRAPRARERAPQGARPGSAAGRRRARQRRGAGCRAR